MADKRAYAKFDIGWLDNPKMLDVVDESHTAVLMHAASILYAAQHLTDGMVPVKLVQRKLAGTDADVDLLVEVGLWHRPGHDCAECEQPPARNVVVHNFLEHNRSEAEAKEASEKAARAARARYKHADRTATGTSATNAQRSASGTAPSSASGTASSTAGSTAGSTAQRNASGMPRERERENPPNGGGPGEPARRRPATEFPDGWQPKDTHRAKAKELGVDLTTEADTFESFHRSKDNRYRDWDQAFHTWLRKARPQPAATSPTTGKPYDPWALSYDDYAHPEEHTSDPSTTSPTDNGLPF